MNVINVEKPSAGILILLYIREFIQERNLMYVMNVGSLPVRVVITCYWWGVEGDWYPRPSIHTVTFAS